MTDDREFFDLDLDERECLDCGWKCVYGQDISVSLRQPIRLDDELVHVVYPFAHDV